MKLKGFLIGIIISIIIGLFLSTINFKGFESIFNPNWKLLFFSLPIFTWMVICELTQKLKDLEMTE